MMWGGNGTDKERNEGREREERHILTKRKVKVDGCDDTCIVLVEAVNRDGGNSSDTDVLSDIIKGGMEAVFEGVRMMETERDRDADEPPPRSSLHGSINRGSHGNTSLPPDPM